MAASIGRLTPADREAWLELWSAYCDFYSARVPEEVTENTWAWVVSGDGPVFGLGARTAGRLSGFVTWQFQPVTWSKQPRCYLEDLFVAESLRGQGLGRALMEAVYRDADDAGADNVYWFTNSDNVRARALYDRIGVHKGMVKYDRK